MRDACQSNEINIPYIHGYSEIFDHIWWRRHVKRRRSVALLPVEMSSHRMQLHQDHRDWVVQFVQNVRSQNTFTHQIRQFHGFTLMNSELSWLQRCRIEKPKRMISDVLSSEDSTTNSNDDAWWMLANCISRVSMISTNLDWDSSSDNATDQTEWKIFVGS